MNLVGALEIGWVKSAGDGRILEGEERRGQSVGERWAGASEMGDMMNFGRVTGEFSRG